MMKASFLLVVCLAVMLVPGRTTTSHNHNGEHYGTLCDLLAAAVQKWKTANNSSVKKALSQAIFGHPNGKGDPSELDLPSTHHKPGNRRQWCGECVYGDQESYPGKSIPHDILCMCTVGENGYPFLEGLDKPDTRLCGRSAGDLGCGQDVGNGKGCLKGNGHWWSENSDRNHAGKYLKATWDGVVKTCLGKQLNLDAEDGLKTLLNKLKIGKYSSPAWAWGHHGCNGVDGAVCVTYGTRCHRPHNTNFPQWWWDLEEALNAPNLTQAELHAAVSQNFTIDTTDSAQTGQQGSSTQAMPSTTSASSTTEESPGKVLPLLSNQQSSASLTHPLLCLLSASFFI
ncbi:Variant surface glycoprotein [Trypanosoma congolense IL3000]|uniref:Variant surface glycoprotein n=1 Tax=Trypanosoma congolense (strain IL3000) TaxID=1068625 RepID=F9WJE6_TRYCI|nr:Variant surface glycoprotein [Trypanosoma congolense IL3000]